MSEDSGQIRLFTAIELPEEWLSSLARVQAQLERAGGDEFKWVRPDLMHITLVFLGYQDADTLPSLSSSLEAAAHQSRQFALRGGHLGGFGPPHALTVVWAGLSETPAEMRALHQNIAEQLRAAEINFDHKPLVPHVTLARGRRPINRDASLRVAGLIQRTELPDLLKRVDSFALMRSRLSPRGPSYEVVERFQLGNRDA